MSYRRRGGMIIQMEFIDPDGLVEVPSITIETELPEQGDRLEEAILTMEEGAARTPATQYLEALSKQQAQQAGKPSRAER